MERKRKLKKIEYDGNLITDRLLMQETHRRHREVGARMSGTADREQLLMEDERLPDKRLSENVRPVFG